jgi:putative pyruvate formate lyase activating enzyme
MDSTRRDFIKRSVVLGGTLLLPPTRLAASPTSREEWLPAYARLEQEGKLAERIERAFDVLEACVLCPRQCGVDRRAGKKGYCRAPSKVMVYSAHPHFGEEVSLVGEGGSGTIFFSNCNLRCVFCQNWPIAHKGLGDRLDDAHVMPHIINATRIAYKWGLRLPLVYNTSGYERVEILELLDGIVDIYLPDLKFMDGEQSARYSAGASDYPEVAKKAILEMNRQVGEHTLDEQDRALRGLMIRHLVMPNRVAGTRDFTRWVAEELSTTTYVNIMAQYHVAYQASEYKEIGRAIHAEEFLEAMDWAEEAGLTNLDPRSVTNRKIFQRHGRG